MPISKRTQLTFLVPLIEWLDRHPILVRIFLKPLANAPFLSARLGVLIRAHMGATAFEIHYVDAKRGRIGIGGVEEIMAGSKIIHLLHAHLAERLGEDEKNRTLAAMGRELCRWEVSQALAGGRWAPAVLVPLIMSGHVLDEVREDPLMARFFAKVMGMMSRLITDEGGWGHLEFDFASDPMTVALSDSQEAAWLGPADAPVCHFYAGIVAGYASTIAGEEITVREVACAATGAPRCLFELTRAKGVSPVRSEK
jgi:hypothetical protein